MAAVPPDAAPGPPSPEDPRGVAPSPPRVRLGIETISDVVFGLSLEIGSIALVAKLPQSGADLAREIVEFGFTFLVIFMVWLAYRRASVVFPHETQLSIIVTVAILFCVAIEPFLFYVTVAATGAPVGGPAATALALDVGAMMLLLAAFYFLLFAEDQKAPHRQIPPSIVRQLRAGSLGRLAAGVVFLVSALPSFDTPGILGFTVREDIWVAALGLFFVIQYGTPSISAGARPDHSR